jgi:hypothetical protein
MTMQQRGDKVPNNKPPLRIKNDREGKPSVGVVRPSGKAVKPLYVEGKGPYSAAGEGRLRPPQTGKPWPGGGTVPPPDEGNQDAIRVDTRGDLGMPAGTKVQKVTPLTSVHFHGTALRA